MKHYLKRLEYLLYFSLLGLMIATELQAQTGGNAVTVNRLPASVTEYEQMRNELATTPEGGAAMFLVALELYTRNPELGMQCIIMQTDRKLLQQKPGAGSYKGFQLGRSTQYRLKDQLKRYPYLPGSYFPGATPQNAYRENSAPWRFHFTTNPYSGDPASGTVKLFIASAGADSPRPIKMQRNNRGVWKAKEFSSILMGIRPPASTTDDDL